MQVQPTAAGARNYSQCDSMLIGDRAGANTYPYIQVCQLCEGLVSGFRLELLCLEGSGHATSAACKQVLRECR